MRSQIPTRRLRLNNPLIFKSVQHLDARAVYQTTNTN